MNVSAERYSCKLYYDKVFNRAEIDAYFKSLIVTKADINNYLYISWPTSYDYYIDPKLHYYLNVVFPSLLSAQIPYYFLKHTKGIIALNDSLCLYSWALWFESQTDLKGLKDKTLIIINFDDYSELSSPLAYIRDKNLFSILNDSFIDVFDSDKTLETVISGTITQGSAYLSFLYKSAELFKKVIIIHLMPEYKNIPLTYSKLLLTSYVDNFLNTPLERLFLKKQKIHQDQLHNCHLLEVTTSDITDFSKMGFLSCNNRITFLDIDFSYFSNRYKQDSDWKELTSVHNPGWFDIKMTINRNINLLKQYVSFEQFKNINFFTSPGYFPSEYWEDTLSILTNNLLDTNKISERLL